MMNATHTLPARAALRVLTPAHTEALAHAIRHAWRELGAQRCTVEVSVIELCARAAEQREADALRLLTLEAQTPMWTKPGVGLQATLIVMSAPHDHLLLLRSQGAAGRRALRTLVAHLRRLHGSSEWPLPESEPGRVMPPAVVQARAALTAA